MSATVKELLKSDSICQSYAQMKKGPVFFWLTVYNIHCVSKKTKPDNFSMILFRSDEMFIKFGGLISEFTEDTTAVAFQRNLCNILTWNVLF